ncbi:MAG: type III-B CRISPR module RAMP protein Cmr1 [Desulfurococcaceae archaeon]
MSKSVLKLKLKNTTPLFVGWYDPRKQDPMGIRATEIKGLWRWWCRAFIAGAMYDQNMLSGKDGKDVYLIPSDEEAEAISCFVGKILGLGYAGKKGAESSRFKLFIDESQEGKTEYQISWNKDKKIKSRQFILNVEKVREKYKDAEDLALKILTVSLQLSGVGKGSRRGQGSMDIVSIESENILENIGNDIGKLIKYVYEKSIEIVSNKECQEMCGIKNIKQTTNKRLPPLPAVAKEVFELCKVNISSEKSSDFVYICKSSVLGRNFEFNELSKWFLGLPRLGYKALEKQSVRRPSPIFMTCHTSDNVFGPGIFVTVFLSGDWPKQLKWMGGGGEQQIDIDDDKIKEAYETFVKEFEDYLNRKGLHCGKITWYQSGVVCGS